VEIQGPVSISPQGWFASRSARRRWWRTRSGGDMVRGSGFALNYSTRSQQCDGCERSGGWCGCRHDQTNASGMEFTCYCVGGLIADRCGTGTLPQAVKPHSPLPRMTSRFSAPFGLQTTWNVQFLRLIVIFLFGFFPWFCERGFCLLDIASV